MEKNVKKEIIENVKHSNWTVDVSKKIYEILEHPNWAEWLEASINSIEWRAKVFPAWQFLLSIWDIPIASLSTNQINWDWNPDTLPCWDEIAGDPTTYEHTYNPMWNTLVLMSMNVDKNYQWLRLTDLLVWEVQKLAKKLWINHIIWSFRPSWFGKYKLNNWVISFEDYVSIKNDDWFSIDPWIRSLQKKWMKPMKVDDKAMTVELSIEEFQKFKKENWVQVKPGFWECGEVWQFEIVWNKAIYKEKNLWWKLPILY